MFLSEEDLVYLLEKLEEVGTCKALAETDFKSSERELKLVYGAAIDELRTQDPKAPITLLTNTVNSHRGYADKVRELREKQRIYLEYSAKYEHIKTTIDVWRTYSANSRLVQ